MPKPNDFFVSVLDFFAILLPGAIAVAILEPRLSAHVLGSVISTPDSEVGKWVIFLILAYFLGHLIFMLGSYIDVVYNYLREKLDPYGNESAFQCAKRIRDQLIEDREQEALNPFQWARSVLIMQHPAAASDVHRLEADSKFFRSLLVICMLATGVFFYDNQPVAAVISAAIGIPCFMRYYERRLKSTTQAYIHVVTMYRLANSDKVIPQDAD